MGEDDRRRVGNTNPVFLNYLLQQLPFPPEIDAPQKNELERLAEVVLVEREKYPEKTIAWLYDPDTMPPGLFAAHRALDEAVEQCYRTKPFTSDEERLEYLFALYEQMTAAARSDLFTPTNTNKGESQNQEALISCLT